MSQRHILIVGAGICGLAIAQGLQKSGISFSIFEAEERTTYRPREWTMAIHWAIPMLEELLPAQLGSVIQSRCAVDTSLDYSNPPANMVPMVDGVSGTVWKELTIPGTYLRVSRRKLRALCAEQIDIQVSTTAARGDIYADAYLVGTRAARHSVPG